MRRPACLRAALLAALGVAACSGLGASGAAASTVQVSGSDLLIRAAANEANGVVVERLNSSFRVTDSGATLTARAGCTKQANGTISCPVGSVTRIKAELGDLDDTATVSGSTPAILKGGDGLDVLRGGAGDDSLYAETGVSTEWVGRDFLAGRGGDDRLDATIAFGSVKLDGGSGDDTLLGNTSPDDVELPVESLAYLSTLFAGGPGSDTIRGTHESDVLDGGTGPDDIHGGTGGPEDTVVYGDRSEPLTINLATTATTNGGPSDALAAGGRRDRLTSVEHAIGGSGPDVLTGAAGKSELFGGLGNDALYGGDGRDRLCGDGTGSTSAAPDEAAMQRACFGAPTGGNDVLKGQNGDDTLFGGLGSDRMEGGADIDGVSYADRSFPVVASIDGAANDGQVDVDAAAAGAQGEKDTIATDVEDLAGTPARDALYGSAAGNRLDGGSDDDVLWGRGGDDVLCGEGVNGAIGGRFFSRGAPCSMGYSLTSSAKDTLNGEAGDDLLEGGAGPDWFSGGAGVDTVTWGRQYQSISATIQDACAGGPCAKPNDGIKDVAPGTEGDQSEGDRVGLDVENLTGAWGVNELVGSDGPNVLTGYSGTDALSGLDGQDVLIPFGGGGFISGGGHYDYVSYVSGYGVSVSLDGVANDGPSGTQDVQADIEGVLGSPFPDTLTGNDANNTLVGYGGADTLSGRGGNDALTGGLGADSLVGGNGNDLLAAEDGAGDTTVDCDGDSAPGTGDRAVFDAGLDAPAGCELQSPIAARSQSVADPQSAAFRDMLRRGQQPSR